MLYMLLVPKKCHTLPSLCQFSSKSSPSAPLLNTPPVKKNDCPVLQPRLGSYSAHCPLMQKGDYEAQQGPLYDLSTSNVASYLAEPEAAMLCWP